MKPWLSVWHSCFCIWDVLVLVSISVRIATNQNRGLRAFPHNLRNYQNTRVPTPPFQAVLIKIFRPPLWPSGRSSWLHIQRSEFDSCRYQIFRELLALERGPLSVMSTTEELLERKRSDSGLEIREYGRRDPSY
jgi:hypothetical protein